ncbi:MAG: ParB/RepB/Spo0J family partition protein, partial [Oscillospiraceae bacterium]
ASRIAGLKEVPIIVRELDDLAATQIALIENLQRENLNPVEEALGYKDLSENFNLTQAEIAESVGKSRSAVANSMRLLSLPKQVIEFLEQGRLSSGHARALLAFENEEDILKVANMALDNKLTVRDVEKLASKKVVEVDENPKPKSRCRDSYYDEVEISLNEELHRKVKIKGKKAGTVEIAFYDKKDLEELIKLFNR